MDLVEFLLARIGEDEAVARRASDEVARLDDAFEVRDPDWRRWSRPSASVTSVGPVAEFVDRQTPARVLAECAAKRWVVQSLNWALPLQYLALPYAEHEDFREEWKV